MTKIGTCSYKNNFVALKNIFNPQLVQFMGGDPINEPIEPTLCELH
jgi:hypothetical protein